MRLREVMLIMLLACSSWARAAEQARPNILWITSDDNGQQLGAYGDSYATTPNLDKLAAKGLRYLNVWSVAPVCAPARTTLISGVYPTATGAEHMRSMVRLPAAMKMYPQYLREAGYYCSNNSKEDYNLVKPGQVWDESSARAHYRNRQPGQPFFAVFNHVISHESQIRQRPHTLVHDPARAPLPPYHPDLPEVRHDWAQYYDKITEMDALVGKNLAELAAEGLADDTIVFYCGDHGAGMPRSKRWPYNSGLLVPLIVYVPEKFRHLAPKGYTAGGASERLVSFADLAPTLLSLIGVRPPAYLHGQAFMGPHEQPAAGYLHGFRGRMDERYDLVRSVRDQRYVYIRNYMPHRIYGQYLNYMFLMPTARVWKESYDLGRLTAPQTFFWETKPAEELYDLQNDPHEVKNLAGSPEYKPVLERLRTAQQSFALRIRDVGFLPETEIHERAQGTTPYEMGHDSKAYPLEKILRMADLASATNAEALAELRAGLKEADSAVRYWAATGLLIRGTNGVQKCADQLRGALEDDAVSVRIVAAEALGRYGERTDLERAQAVLIKAARLEENNYYAALQALNGIAGLGKGAAGLKEKIAALPTKTSHPDNRTAEYVPRLIEKLLEDL